MPRRGAHVICADETLSHTGPLAPLRTNVVPRMTTPIRKKSRGLCVQLQVPSEAHVEIKSRMLPLISRSDLIGTAWKGAPSRMAMTIPTALIRKQGRRGRTHRRGPRVLERAKGRSVAASRGGPSIADSLHTSAEQRIRLTTPAHAQLGLIDQVIEHLRLQLRDQLALDHRPMAEPLPKQRCVSRDECCCTKGRPLRFASFELLEVLIEDSPSRLGIGEIDEQRLQQRAAAR